MDENPSVGAAFELAKAGKLDEAAQLLQALLDADTIDLTGAVLLAQVHLAQERPIQAAQILFPAWDSRDQLPDESRVPIGSLLAQACLTAQEWIEALRVLVELRALDGGEAEALSIAERVQPPTAEPDDSPAAKLFVVHVRGLLHRVRAELEPAREALADAWAMAADVEGGRDVIGEDYAGVLTALGTPTTPDQLPA
ncbi:MAG: hypothetical protein ACI8PZ_003305 [Myxococcota bacterium]|jgi:hypothetical protein